MIKEFFKKLKAEKIKALVVELGPEPKLYFTEADKDFPDALAQAAFSAALRIAMLNNEDPEEVGEALIAHVATRMHAYIRKARGEIN